MRLQITALRASSLDNVCWQCTRRIIREPRRQLSGTSARSASVAISASPRLKTGYFLSNGLLGQLASSQLASTRGNAASSTAAAGAGSSDARSPVAERSAHPNAHLPHRRRQAQRRGDTAPALHATLPSDSKPLPPDASSVLAGLAAQQPADSLRRTFSAMLSLTKPRLTILVVLSAMAPYALYPVPAFLSSSALATAAPSLSPLTLLFLTTGTTLCSAAANALNMLYESDTDAKMSRTRTRPLVRGLLSKRAAVLFAVGCAVVGTAALQFGVNPTTAFLGAANIALYAGVYTPLKRVHWINTWVGAIVGGIPPLMGWAAAAGESATGDGSFRELLFASDGSSIGGWLFAGLLCAWQFPHFMALSWGVREEYKTAGLKMLSWVNPARNARVALRYSLVFVPLCIGLCAVGVTEWSFAVTSLPINLWLVREAVRFWKYEGHKGSARGLFWASIWHLPGVMVLALLQKKGMWGRIWRSIMGEPDLEEDDAEWEDDLGEAGVARGGKGLQ